MATDAPTQAAGGTLRPSTKRARKGVASAERPVMNPERAGVV